MTLLGFALAHQSIAQQGSALRFGSKVPADVKRIYQRGLNHLVQTQDDSGSWMGTRTSSNQNGINALCILALLASGEDPNHGQYAASIRRGLKRLILSQESDTGYFENSMYNHGFSMLALAEAYGAVDDQLLWKGSKEEKGRSVGEALELAVRCAITSQNQNPYGAWRYSPEAKDADTSVAGAVFVGLLAARNAGIEVPDENMDRAFDYFALLTSKNGSVSYSGLAGGPGTSLARSSIGTLVFAIGKRKDWKEYARTSKHIKDNIDNTTGGHFSEQYTSYYLAQALFQSDFEAWKVWNERTIRHFKNLQNEDGSFEANYGHAFGTSMSLLALALNYRLLPIYER